MSNKVAKKSTTNLPATDDVDAAYEDFHRRSSGDAVLFTSFQKGAWYAGREKDVIEPGVHMLANTPLAESGWLKWQGGAVVESRMQLVSDGPYSYREDLGDLDSRTWEVDETSGRPMDPWVETFRLPLRDPETVQDYSFSTSSFGGRKAVGQLIWHWRKAVRDGRTGCPIVELGSDSYRHRKYGVVFYPTLEIVGWEGGEDVPPEPAKPKRPSNKSKAKADRAELDDELNDDLPVFA